MQKDSLPKKVMQKCPVCGKEYNYSKVKVLDVGETAILSFLKCGDCESGVALKIFLMPQGMVGQAVITDLDSNEIEDYQKNKEKVSSSDVLFVYDFLKNKGFDLVNNLK